MGNFGGIGEAEVYEKGVFLTAGGGYELEVQNILLKDTQRSGLGFIVEFRILEVVGEEAERNHPVGSKGTWFQKMTDKTVALPSIKAFMISLMKIDMRDTDAMEEFNAGLEDLLDEITEPLEAGEDHPLAGERIHCETYTKLTKKNVEFTVHNWSESRPTREELSA
jgi:hypothetical protein